MSSRTLSKYRIIIELARGGMGDVFLAVSQGALGFHKLVVLKELRSSLTTDPELLKMFMSESRLSARLHHPNIVQTNEVGQDGERHFMAMEYLDGQTMHRCVQRMDRETFGMSVQLRLLLDVLGGLHYAHELADYDGSPLGIVHRDISPHNILVTYDGQAKILDFGIAKTRDSAQQTATGVIKGKVPYMAPEQLERNHDRRADIFSIGIMLWEAIAGRRIWASKTDLGIIKALSEGSIPDIRDAAPDVPEALERIVMRALIPNPIYRYPTAQAMADELEAYLGTGSAIAAPKHVGKVVAQAFAVEREAIRTVVDAQLRKLQAGEVVIDTNEGDTSIPKLALPQAGEMTPSDSRREMSTGRTPGGASMARASSSSGVAARARRVTVALIAGGALVAATAIIVTASRRATSSESLAAEGAAARATSSAPPVAPRSQVLLTLNASPPDAHFFVDDVLVVGNPYTGMVAGGVSHTIRAEAKGYVMASATRVADNDMVLSLALQPSAANAPTHAPAAPSPRPVVHVAPAARAKPRAPQPAPNAPPLSTPHSIDSADPYAK